MFRTNVDEMDVEPIDLGDELRQRIQSRFDLAPVVSCRPILRELLHRRKLHALRCIRDGFAFRPTCRLDASAQIDELRFRHMHTKWTDRGFVAASRWGNLSNGLTR